jgi:hypothetical protein
MAGSAHAYMRGNTLKFYEWLSELKHPPSVEVGDWYSSEGVSPENIERIIIGREMVDWLKPHEVDFRCRYRGILQRRNRDD